MLLSMKKSGSVRRLLNPKRTILALAFSHLSIN